MRVALVALVVAVLLPAEASGHANLLRSSPSHGDVLERAPRTVVLTFDEGIESAFVRLQVYDAGGRRVDSGPPYHPAAREELVAVRLPPRLAGRFVGPSTTWERAGDNGHP